MTNRLLSLFAVLLLAIAAEVQGAEAANGAFATAMESAATTRAAPLPLIEAITYVGTRWEWISTPADDGGVGPMHVLPSQIDQAAALSGHTRAQITGDLNANIDAGAALLANFHTSGVDLTSWQSAVTTTQGPQVTNQIYDVLRSGATRTTSTGETITLAPQALPSSPPRVAAPATNSSTDYGPATWVPAASTNYSVFNRPHEYQVNMIIIHDTEGSYSSAIQEFQDPTRLASAHYVISYQGDVTQMVREKDVAWHAGNWDYNTRAIGIEHEGFAWTPNLYTTNEYIASAQLAASICSRWGVPLDRTHVIGHNEVPDPNNPGLFGGADHHTDPGPYWDWTRYMALAQSYATTLPSLPHMGPDPVAVDGLTSITVSWQPAQSCHADAPITSYTIVGQPGNLTATLPATATSWTFNGLQTGTAYTFTVTATNAQGSDSLTSNPAIPGACTSVAVNPNVASPQLSGTQVQLTASPGTCSNPQYEFWLLPPGGTAFQLMQAYSNNATFKWDTTGKQAGTYSWSIWARDASSPGVYGNSAGQWDVYDPSQYVLTSMPCTALSVSASPASSANIGTAVTMTASASGCPKPSYQFWILAPGASSWQVAQAYSSSPTLNWNTAGKPAGTYGFSVWAHDNSSLGAYGNSSGRWDAYSSSQYTVTSTPCTAVGVSSSPPSTARTGTAVTITGSASGCPKPSYQFWVLAPGATSWTVAQAYSSSATFNWATTGKAAGTYGFSVWVRDASSTGTSGNSSGKWDAYSSSQYTLTTPACTGVSVSSSPPSSATVGTTVTLTAGASGCPSPQYQFWVLAPGATSWTLAQAYSTSATFTWNTGGKAAGTYHFSVWVRDSGSAGTFSNGSGTWDAYYSSQYTLS